MTSLILRPVSRLSGCVSVSGAKNCILALIPAALLSSETVTFLNVPTLDDVQTYVDILKTIGVTADYQPKEHKLSITAHSFTPSSPPDLSEKIRASMWLIAPFLVRYGKAVIPLPGGDKIGARHYDRLTQGLSEMGATVVVEEGAFHAGLSAGLSAADIDFSPKITVGPTHCMVMTAVLAKGTTTLRSAACEPEVSALCRMLVSMGAKISGIGTDTLTIEGVPSLSGTTFTVIPDRIEGATYAMIAGITRSKLELLNLTSDLIPGEIDMMTRIGMSVTKTNKGLLVDATDRVLKPTDVKAKVFPDYPSDMQPQGMALLATIDGASMMTEYVYENRFRHVSEFIKMGADIVVHNDENIQQYKIPQLFGSAMIRGGRKLIGTTVKAPDIRAGIALVMLGLVAEGETIVEGAHHLDRAYEDLEGKLSVLGADIRRMGN